MRSRLTVWSLQVRYPALTITGGCYLGRGCEITCSDDSRLEIDASHIGRGCVLRADNGGHLRIIDCGIGSHSVIVSADTIVIGPGCTIAEMVVIRDQDHSGDVGRVWEHGRFVTGPVMIGDRVWIGAKATILKGVTIGEDAVIGAGAVVTRDVTARAVVAGVPARPVNRRG